MTLRPFNAVPSIPHITPFSTPLPALLVRQETSKKFEYPACRDDPDGPCKLQSSSSDACKRQFATLTEFSVARENWCRCTNGYIERSSECMIECYGASKTSKDVVSISRESRLAQLRCESWSFAMDDETARLSRTLIAANRTSVASRSASSERVVPGASVGATAPPNAEETAAWAQRPSTTNQVQRGSAHVGYQHAHWTLWSVIALMTLPTILGTL